jgi:hypothetical protein
VLTLDRQPGNMNLNSACLVEVETHFTSPPSKVPNIERRSREHLTPAAIDRLIAAARRPDATVTATPR